MINNKESNTVSAIICSDTTAVVVRQEQIVKLFFENGYTNIGNLIICRQFLKNQNQSIIHKNNTLTHTNSVIKRLKNNLFDSLFELRDQLKKSDDTINWILFSDIPYLSLLYLQHYCKKHNVMLLYDCYDWYSTETVTIHLFSTIELYYTRIMNTLFRRSIIKSDVKVIVVSTYLQNYFEKQGKSTLRIPITMDKESIHPLIINNYENDRLTVIYAGNPGKRDYVGLVIKAISKLNINEQEMIRFIIVGIDIKQLAQLLLVEENTLSDLPYLEILGRRQRREVITRISQADFSILIRSSTERYAKAGFPTKVVESLMSSTPVICNMTSDLGIYLNDGYDCICVENDTIDAVTSSLRRILSLSRSEKIQMKINARKTAEKYFDNKIYIESFGKFIQCE